MMLGDESKKKLREIREKLKWAMNLYSQAGDAIHSHKQYRMLAKEARTIITEQVSPALHTAIAEAVAEMQEVLPCGHHRGCIWTGDGGTGHCVACEAVAEEQADCEEIAFSRERQMVKAEGISRASIVAGQIAAAIRARGKERWKK